jgi:outer membrane protein assembly factor BamB
MLGRRLLLNEGSIGKSRTLRLYDPLTGQTLWKREFTPTARLLDNAPGGFVGMLDPKSGQMELLRDTTGEPIFKATLKPADADHLNDLGKLAIFADHERYYVALNRTDVLNRRYPMNYSPLRTAAVGGALYVFDRATAQQLWHSEKFFDGQQLIVEQFAETPALVVQSQTVDDQTGQSQNKVSVVDKRNGKLRFSKSYTQGGPLFAVSPDPKTGRVELRHQQASITIVPEGSAEPAKR